MAPKTVNYLLLVILYYLVDVRGQCITGNDVISNETSIGTAVRTLIDGSLDFSLNMLRVLNYDQRTNVASNGLFFSPYSVWSALMVTYMGAKGPTEVEMKNVLGIGSNIDKMTAWDAFRNIRNWNQYQQVQPQDTSYHIANRIFFQKGISFKECMKDMLDIEIAFLDFEKQPESARDEINAWVEDQTKQKIKDLIPADGVHSLTNMIIANAVYFKENWMQQFDPALTRRRRFTLSSRNQIFVNMMNMRGRFMYGKSEELQCYALELPYSGNDLSMTILLPNNRYNGINILANSLTPERLKNILDDLYPREVMVSIPKFKMEDSFELKSVLSKMGLRSLFDMKRVDLSGFTGQREFTVDAVHHKAFIEVNEEGTEAAAATGIITSRNARPIGPAAFIADYPFVFFIRDNLSNVILFLGTVQKPPEYGTN